MAKPQQPKETSEAGLDRRTFLRERIEALRVKLKKSGQATRDAADEAEWNALNNELRELDEAAVLAKRQAEAAAKKQSAGDPPAVTDPTAGIV